MIRRLSAFFTRVMENYLPDAYLFAIALTFLSFILALIFTKTGPIALATAWGNGLWGILTFAMQMILILITGHALALTRPVQKLLGWIASLAKTPAMAVAIVVFVAAIASWVQWGFGLVVGGLLAREMARRQRAHFPLLIAAAYSGFLIWHMGLSGSAPLTSASAGNPANHIEKIFGYVVPISHSIFASWNLITAVILAVTLPVVLYLAYPKQEDVRAIDPASLDEGEVAASAAGPVTFAQRLENSVIINLLLVALGAVYIVNFFVTKGFNLDLNIVIAIFLFLGILLHGTPINYVRAINTAIRGAGGIALQFPLYGGIQGIMGAGLATVIAGWFLAISSPHTFYLLQFWAAGLINMFIPSGGGQWAAQGSIAITAAKAASMNPVKTMMMLAWGDQWTNMIQPFWALPLLGLAGLKPKDIMGYTTLTLIWGGIVMSVVALLIAF
ncbi:MAG: short-chain fatty acid transporter [Symbiobacteriia bacterium]